MGSLKDFPRVPSNKRFTEFLQRIGSLKRHAHMVHVLAKNSRWKLWSPAIVRRTCWAELIGFQVSLCQTMCVRRVANKWACPFFEGSVLKESQKEHHFGGTPPRHTHTHTTHTHMPCKHEGTKKRRICEPSLTS